MNKKQTPSRKRVKRKYHIEMTPWSILLWLCCSIFLMAWVFVLGILVGRGFLSQSMTGISSLKSQWSKLQGRVFQSKRSEQEPEKKEDYDSKLAFYNELSSKRDEAKKRGISEFKPEPQKKEMNQEKREVTQDPVPEVKAEPSAKESGVKKKAEPPKPVVSEAGPLSAKGRYTLQLASLEERSKAEESIQKLMNKGYDAYYYEVQIRGKTWYRVRCGRFATKDEAEEVAKKLAKESGLKGLVTKLE